MSGKPLKRNERKTAEKASVPLMVPLAKAKSGRPLADLRQSERQTADRWHIKRKTADIISSNGLRTARMQFHERGDGCDADADKYVAVAAVASYRFCMVLARAVLVSIMSYNKLCSKRPT